jgi:hypothetical protein
MVLDRPISDTGSFKVVEDQDLIVEEYDDTSEPEIIDIIPRKEDKEEKKQEEKVEEVVREEPKKEENVYNYYEEPKEEVSLYNEKRNLYNMDNKDIRVHEYGSVNKRESSFKPSPIISPIYGILDKNYKKEDIVSKEGTERTGGSFERHRVTVDEVRKKAYGTLTDELVDDMDRELEKVEEDATPVQEEETLLVDLSKDSDKPAVKEITVGDAVEYYDDLGLEYNVDYKDASLEKKKKDKEKVEEKVEEVKPKEEIKEEKVEEVVEKPKENVPDIIESNFDTKSNTSVEVDDDSDDNLFDLIDSMYQEKEV